MSFHYYVNKIAQNNGDHEVHKNGCMHTPAPANAFYLVYFDNCRDAVRQAMELYDQVNGCYFCKEGREMMNKSRFLAGLVLLLVASVGLGCDGDNSRQPEPTPAPTPTPGCIQLENELDALFEFAECPTEGLVQFCNSYGCNFYDGDLPTSPLVLQGSTTFSNCEVIDCFNVECAITGFNDYPNAAAVLSIEEILDNSNIAGLSSLDGAGEFTFECSPIVP
jgi:hypothetical protein